MTTATDHMGTKHLFNSHAMTGLFVCKHGRPYLPRPRVARYMPRMLYNCCTLSLNDRDNNGVLPSLFSKYRASVVDSVGGRPSLTRVSVVAAGSMSRLCCEE